LLDKIGKLIGQGGVALVFSALLKEKNVEMAVKAFFPTDSSFSIERDLSTGFEKRLITEYTLNYEDEFVAGEIQCVVMKLMKTSLEKVLNRLINSNPKIYLSDEVYF
jgi:serine/threonine protein kinase